MPILLAIYMAFLEISQMYCPVAANIKISQTSLYKEARKLNLCQFCLLLRQSMTTIYIYVCDNEY